MTLPGADKVFVRDDGALRWLVFNHPEKRNAITFEMRERALQALAEIALEERARVLIVTGGGDRSFISGGDISQFERQPDEASAERKHMLFTAIRQFEKPTLAMIHGYCFGAGLALAACCDLRLCSEEEILRNLLHYDEDRIARLRELQVIAAPSTAPSSR